MSLAIGPEKENVSKFPKKAIISKRDNITNNLIL